MKKFMKFFMVGIGCMLTGLVIGCESVNSAPANTLSITPASVYLTAGKVNAVNLSASGGSDTNYTWTVNNTSLGALFPAGATAVYESTTIAGINTVVVTDGANDTASVVITQQ